MIIDDVEFKKIHNARNLIVRTNQVNVIIDKDEHVVIIGDDNCFNMYDDCKDSWYSRSMSDNEYHVRMTFGQVLYAICGNLLEFWMIDDWQKNIDTIEYE